MVERFFYNENEYSITYNKGENFITIKNYSTDKVFYLTVKESTQFSWKLNKKSVSAIGGAQGLFSFFSRALQSNFMTSYLYKTLAYFCI